MTIPAAEARKLHATLDQVETILKASKVRPPVSVRRAPDMARLREDIVTPRTFMNEMVAAYARQKRDYAAMLAAAHRRKAEEREMLRRIGDTLSLPRRLAALSNVKRIAL